MRHPVIPIILIAALAFTACGNKSQNGGAYSTSHQTDSLLDRHSKEYIAERVDAIYDLQNDSLCCSESFCQLDAQAQKQSEQDGTVYRDADHWVAGQDVADDWNYQLQSIQINSDSTATAEVIIHNFDDQRVVLDLVFERGDWYVDNFHFFYEGQDYDADGNPIPDSDGIKELDERKALKDYIREEKVGDE